MKKVLDKQRNSTIELLRILCILMIVFMHLVGIWWDYCDNLFDKEFVIFVNSLCNCAVTIFMLISGYYGIRFNLRKIVQFEMMVIFYSILFIFMQYSLIGGVGMKEMVKSVFPLLTSKYWFYTAYVIIFFVSPYIHLLVNFLNKKEFKILIGILLLFLAILIFSYFRKISPFSSSIVNRVSTYCFSLYVISSSMLPFIRFYGGKNLDYFILLIFFFVICLSSLIIESIRRCLLDTVFIKMSDWICNIVEKKFSLS